MQSCDSPHSFCAVEVNERSFREDREAGAAASLKIERDFKEKEGREEGGGAKRAGDGVRLRSRKQGRYRTSALAAQRNQMLSPRLGMQEMGGGMDHPKMGALGDHGTLCVCL